MLCCGQRANISLKVPFCTKSSVSSAPPAIRWRVFKDWNPDDSGILLWAWERKERKMERKRFERDEMYKWDSFAFELIEECHASFLEKTRHRTAIRNVYIAIRKGPLLISVKTPLGAQRKGETSVVLSPRIMFNLYEGMSFPIKDSIETDWNRLKTFELDDILAGMPYFISWKNKTPHCDSLCMHRN